MIGIPPSPLPTQALPNNTLSPLQLLHLFPNCKSLHQVRQLHAQIYKTHLQNHNPVIKQLLQSYISFGALSNVLPTISQMQDPNVYVWNTAIKAYTIHGPFNIALHLYVEMLQHGTPPANFSFPVILKAIASLGALSQGQQVHACILKSGTQITCDVFIANSLLNMYAKCDELEAVRQVFDTIPCPNVITFTALLDALARSGDMDGARAVFEEMPERNVFSWTAMLVGYVRNDMPERALLVFRRMQREGVRVDEVAVLSALSACARVGALELGRWIHDYAGRNRLRMGKVSLTNALIDMYAKCGEIDEALAVFNAMAEKSVVSWNVMISGLAIHGLGLEALQLFRKMHENGFEANEATFVGVLSSCSHNGLVEEGYRYFNAMHKVYGVKPNIRHYGCMVDLLGRAGQLKEALDLINSMPMEPNAVVWGALLAACRRQGDVELGEYAMRKLIQLEPESSGNYVLLSNAYAVSGRWDDSAKVRAMMRGVGVAKEPGCSWVEVKNMVHEFVAGDKSHPQSDNIYKVLNDLGERLKTAGYVPDTSSVLHDIEEEAKEELLGRHSEKLAIAFALINTEANKTIRVVKNLRVCSDCHTMTKYITKVLGREIIMRDRNRFHCFKDGSCSCGDYW
eukprot:TRINITY_DN10893_c0_g1_i1.p1 TRINITY_DN10893_c0_g1~~TRINITY_DN10893_c0_g1_i1.p1  ORF type:complete len:627 (+),score=102.52 TRINITY_DN10893_c0_g1_i1:102-1982(+)